MDESSHDRKAPENKAVSDTAFANRGPSNGRPC
jgi:hypothetical protein